jgi:hypothetical protein
MLHTTSILYSRGGLLVRITLYFPESYGGVLVPTTRREEIASGNDRGRLKGNRDPSPTVDPRYEYVDFV